MRALRHAGGKRPVERVLRLRDHDADWNVGSTLEKAQLCGDHIRGRDGHGHPPTVMPSCSGYRRPRESAEVNRRMRLLYGLGPALGCIEIDVLAVKLGFVVGP